jgi:arylsulfatase A-like enzyme
MDGASLLGHFNDQDKPRATPLFFWMFEDGPVFDETSIPYIDPELQEGTTPLVKKMDGKFTRTFRNFHYDSVSAGDFSGMRTMMKGQYKLVLEGASPNVNGYELYDLENDPGERKNLADELPDLAEGMQGELRLWQESVLNSLTGADYQD